MADLPLSDQTLRALAPQQLHSYRATRYGGEGLSVRLSIFGPHDRAVIERLYHTLLGLREMLGGPNADARSFKAAREHLAQAGWAAQIDAMRQFGDTLPSNGEPHLRGVLHDLRGGAFQALAIHLQLLDMGLTQPEDVTRIFLLTRDHLKIMRNCLPDLDPQRYAQDRVDRAHSVRLLIEKWDRNDYQMPGVTARITLDCRFDGIISERCIEFAALDRVIYNLVNNAARHTADGRVYIVILPQSADTAQNLRFIVYNRVSPEHAQTLTARYGDQLGALFRGGFTTGGTGQGMAICASFVINAYGLQTIDQALADGYIGAALQEGYFVNWVHWPTVAD